jgi:hypothetical protein
MGKNKKQVQANENVTNVANQANAQYETTMGGPGQAEAELGPFSQNSNDLAGKSNYRQMSDYGDIMGQYDQIANSPESGPRDFSYQHVTAKRPEELNEAYGYLREAAPGYSEFAKTGGYSGQDIQELRARGMSPIRSAYGNTMMELDRARSLGGGGGAPNYIAAASKAQRELPGQMADAMTGVNAQLAQDIRKGRLEGLAGLRGVGGDMGGLSSAEAGRTLSADQGNQAADLQAQSLSEQSRRAAGQERLAALSGKTSLYGTTPAMANMFGNQALQAYGMRGGFEQGRQRTGLDLLSMQMGAYQNQANQPQGPSKTSQILGYAGMMAPYAAAYFGRNGGKNQYPIAMEATDIGGGRV